MDTRKNNSSRQRRITSELKKLIYAPYFLTFSQVYKCSKGIIRLNR